MAKMSWLCISVCILYAIVITSSTANSDNTTDVSSTTEAPPLEQTLNGIRGTKAQLCSEKPCIRKCCSINSIGVMIDRTHNSGTCSSKKKLNLIMDFPAPTIYTRDREATGKKLNSTFQIIKGWSVIRDGWITSEDLYVIEDGTLMVELSNIYDRWRTHDLDHFCVDYVKLHGSGEVVLRAFVLVPIEDPYERNHLVSLIAMLISSMFLIVTLAVYGYVPRLRRKLHGKVLVAYAACLLGFFITQSIYQIVYETKSSTDLQCHIMGIPSYFLILAAFFWMNIMSFDIWFKLRSMLYISSSVNNNGRNRFVWYCVYGFGAPLAMSIVFAFLNYLPMDKINKAIVTPGITSKGCFLGGMERLFYLYIPMAVLIAVNFFLFLATAVIIYRLNSNKSSSGSHKKQFLVYINVFLVMGVSWLLEIISSIEPTLLIWKFTDAYNSLMGLFIFLIFVCNKQVFRMVAYRYHGGGGNSKSPTTRIDHDSESSENAEEVTPSYGLILN